MLFLLIWVIFGLLSYFMLQRLFRMVEKDIEEGDTELAPHLSLIYSIIESNPWLLPVICMLFWPWFVFAWLDRTVSDIFKKKK